MYLVTGGAGFIGSNLVARLVARGQRVRVLDNFSTGRAENLAPWRDQIEVLEGDIRDAAVLGQAMPGVRYVLHQAALPSVPRSVADPLTSHEVNATGTLQVLLAAREAGVQRVVYASSSSVYGEGAELPKHEGMMPAPVSPYAVSKLAGEQYCRAFWTVYGLQTVCLRYFNVFGPGQDPGSAYAAVVPRFATALLDGGPPVIYGDGQQSRDFTYVENVVAANLLACEVVGAAGEVFNVACGERFTVRDLLAGLEAALGRTAEPVFEVPRPGEIRHSLASIERARARLGYEPVVAFEEGLRRTAAWYAGRRGDGRRTEDT